MKKVINVMICLLIVFWHILGNCMAEAIKLDELKIEAKSFDYSTSHNWGFYSMEYFDDFCVEKNKKEYSIEYIGMNFEQQSDMFAHPERWYKCWIRLEIQPCINWEMEYSARSLNPLDYVDLRIENVRISNAEQIGVFPKPFLMFAANPTYLYAESQNMKVDGSDMWYMEVMIERRDRTEEEITRDLQKAEVFCDVIYLDGGQKYTKRDFPILLSSINRKMHFDENAIRIFATEIKKSNENVYYIFSNYDMNETVWEEVCNTPELFTCYELKLVMINEGTYDVRDVARAPKQIDENVWLVRYDTEYKGQKRCKSGETSSLTGFFLIIKNNHFSEKEIREIPLRMEVYTEFAGLINETENSEGVMGRNGIPFPIEIDMSSCK